MTTEEVREKHEATIEIAKKLFPDAQEVRDLLEEHKYSKGAVLSQISLRYDVESKYNYSIFSITVTYTENNVQAFIPNHGYTTIEEPFEESVENFILKALPDS